MNNSVERFTTASHRKKCNLLAELEEIKLSSSEREDALEMFEYDVVVSGLDPISQKIAAEKFVKFMSDWMRSAQLCIDKMRLHLATAKQKFKKICVYLEQKKELGENIRTVDFEKIIIENQHFVKKIELKNLNLVELKKMSGNSILFFLFIIYSFYNFFFLYYFLFLFMLSKFLFNVQTLILRAG